MEITRKCNETIHWPPKSFSLGFSTLISAAATNAILPCIRSSVPAVLTICPRTWWRLRCTVLFIYIWKINEHATHTSNNHNMSDYMSNVSDYLHTVMLPLLRTSFDIQIIEIDSVVWGLIWTWVAPFLVRHEFPRPADPSFLHLPWVFNAFWMVVCLSTAKMISVALITTVVTPENMHWVYCGFALWLQHVMCAPWVNVEFVYHTT